MLSDFCLLNPMGTYLRTFIRLHYVVREQFRLTLKILLSIYINECEPEMKNIIYINECEPEMKNIFTYKVIFDYMAVYVSTF